MKPAKSLSSLFLNKSNSAQAFYSCSAAAYSNTIKNKLYTLYLLNHLRLKPNENNQLQDPTRAPRTQFTRKAYVLTTNKYN